MAYFLYCTPSNSFFRSINLVTGDPESIGGVLHSDNFEAPLDPQRWSVTKPDPAAVVAAVAGLLQFKLVNGYAYNTIENQQLFSMIGKTITLDIITHLAGSYVESYMQLVFPSGGYCYIYEENNNLLCRIFNSAGSQVVTQFYGAVGNAQTKWRMRHDADGSDFGTLYLETFDGSNWITRVSSGSLEAPLDLCAVRIIAGRYSGGAGDEIFEADNFVYSGDDPDNPPAPIVVDSKQITKTTGGDGWNSGLLSKAYIAELAADQSIRAVIKGGANTYRMFGWSKTARLDYEPYPDFGFYIKNDNSLWCVLDGAEENTGLSAADGNECRIQIVKSGDDYKIRWLWRVKSSKLESKRKEVIKTAAQMALYMPMQLKAIFYTQGGILNNLSIEGNGSAALSYIGSSSDGGNTVTTPAGASIPTPLAKEMTKSLQKKLGIISGGSVVAPPPVTGQLFPRGLK